MNAGKAYFRKLRAEDFAAMVAENNITAHFVTGSTPPFLHAFETANRIHQHHNPHLISVGYNAFATRYEIREAARRLAERIDGQILDRLLAELGDHWPKLPVPFVDRGET